MKSISLIIGMLALFTSATSIAQNAIIDIAANKKGSGRFTIKTISGETLTAQISDGNVILYNESAGMAKVTDTDLQASNGIIHAIDSVLLPKS